MPFDGPELSCNCDIEGLAAHQSEGRERFRFSPSRSGTGAASVCFFRDCVGAFKAGAGARAGVVVGADFSCWRGVEVDAAELAAHQSEGRERCLFRTSAPGA